MQLFYNCVQFSAKPGLFGESHYHRLVHFGRIETIVEERRRLDFASKQRLFQHSTTSKTCIIHV